MAEHCNSRLSRPVLLGGSMLEMPQMKPSKHSLVVVLKYMRSDWLTTIAFTAAMGCFGFSGTPRHPARRGKFKALYEKRLLQVLDDCDAEVTAFMVPRTERDRRRMFHVERGTLAPWENVVRSTVFQHGDYPYIYIYILSIFISC